MNKHLSKVKAFVGAKADYLYFYQRTLPDPKNVTDVLEIGFDLQSLKALSEIFPTALIHVMDFFEKIKVSKDELENMGIFVYDFGDSSARGVKKISTISTKFDVIIDRGSCFKDSRQIVFSTMFEHNLKPHGLYYMEKISKNAIQNLARALFDKDISFRNVYINKDTMTRLVDTSEWADMDQTEDIVGVKKSATPQAAKAKTQKAKPELPAENKPPIVDPAVQPDKQPENTPEAQAEEPQVVKYPSSVTVKLFGGRESTFELKDKFGPVRKDILISYLGKPVNSPRIFEIYGSHTDFYFCDLEPDSDRYRLEMARSTFSVCVDDRSIVNALVNDSIPVILSGNSTSPLYDHSGFPCMVICSPEVLQGTIGNIYMHGEVVNSLVANGKLLLKKLFKL